MQVRGKGLWGPRLGFVIWLVLFGTSFVLHQNVGALMLVLMAVAYAVGAFFFVRRQKRMVRLVLNGGMQVQKGQTARVEAVLSNASRLPVLSCRVRFMSTNRLTEECVDREMAAFIPPRGSVTKTLTLSDRHCGLLQTAVSGLFVYDALHLFGMEADTGDCRPGPTTIMPTLSDLEIPAEYMEHYDLESFRYSETRQGSDPGQVYGVRPYRAGDSPKAIHWKLSAKMEEMTVKIPSYPIENRVVILLDHLQKPGASLSGQEKSRLADLFCSLSWTLAKKGIAHQLAWYQTGESRLVRRQVVQTEDLIGAIPSLFQAGFAEDGQSLAYRYLEAAGREDSASFFLVTAGDARDMDLLEQYGAVRIFRIGEEDKTA